MTALEPEGSGDHTVHLPKLGANEINGFLRFAQIRRGGLPLLNFFRPARRGEARLAIPQHSAIVAKARKGTTGMPVVGFISEKGGVGKTSACYHHIAIAFAPRFGVGWGIAGSR